MFRWWRLVVFTTLLLMAWPSLSAADFSLKSYLNLRDKPQTQESLRTYFIGVGRGIFWANVLVTTNGTSPIFCMPKGLALDEGIIQSILNQEIRENDEKHVYESDTPVELILVHAFINKFPCTTR